ncbi:asparagine synthase (glutamine-hydrolyzing) [Casimicrobium huifangae]|uniref:asparagine synthase (glutamine-hydrolyzing) n=1 Tax=Casimicrobium huifangae TaxID=2591109 RepID=UPI0012EBD384|nr:asparagine synthase (glutamine-hydrolyzing) [Casimicrobium huifangae]
MSGIAGIIHFDGRPVEPGQVEAMTAAMPYRGPDGTNHWRRGNVALGQCMLRTTPESLEETQPLSNEDESLVLVMDGRVDNWEELRQTLLSNGVTLRTRADAELVLRAYEVWASDCVQHIDGDFAFVIWDARRQRAFCARDPAGNKPFNYHWNGQSFVFSSELRAILPLPWVPERLNLDVAAEYLATEWHSLDETLWQSVMRLKPSHSLEVGGGQSLHQRRYWHPDLQHTLPCRNDDEYIEHYRALFFDVVRRMSRSTHPVACEVSGGLDSSAIFAVAETLRQRAQLPAPGVEGYTLDFSGDPAADEMDYARAVGAFLGRHVHEVVPAHKPLHWYRDNARWYREFPDYPNGAMGEAIVDLARASNSRALFSGVGGDEWTGGSHIYYAEAIAGWQARDLLALMLRDARAAGPCSMLRWLLLEGVSPSLPSPLRLALRKLFHLAVNRAGKSSKRWLAADMACRLDRRRKKFVGESAPICRRIGQRELLRHLPQPYNILAREVSERRTSRAGLELRLPFWNKEIVQCAFSRPAHLNMRGNEDRWLHRQGMAHVLPEKVLQRQTKAEFSVTFRRYWPELLSLLADDILPARPGWVEAQEFGDIVGQAFSMGSHDFRGGWVAWTLFGLDTVVCD